MAHSISHWLALFLAQLRRILALHPAVIKAGPWVYLDEPRDGRRRD